MSEATATVEEGDDPQVVGEGLKAFVSGQLRSAVVKDAPELTSMF